MVLNAAVQMLREADELKQKILKFKSGTSMLQERSLWVTQQQLQKVYQKVLVLDLDYALEKKVEQDLWNVGFKQQIEALQAISKDRKNPLRSEGQAMLSWVLQAAAGFYLCLLHQICTTFKLDLPFRRRASLLGWVEGWGAGEAPGGARLPPPAAARYICQHCLVHLGDLARYRQQLRVAHTFYRHALVVSAHSGQPYNQLALVAWRRGRRLAALYWHVRSLLVRAPFPPAPANLARTLHAAASGGLSRESLPVLPGVPAAGSAAPAEAPPARLDAHSYVTELIRAMHYIHTVDQLDTAATIVESLNSSLTALIATDSFESMTLIKMACVLIWLVHSSTEDLRLEDEALSAGEAAAARLAESLAAAAVLALLLPAYTLPEPPQRALPALKVWVSWWATCARAARAARGACGARRALGPALAHALNRLAHLPPKHLTPTDRRAYDTVPLPEDEELHGFLPLEEALRPLRFAHAAWDAYGGRVPGAPDVPDVADDDPSIREVSPTWLSSEPELERRVRAHRLLQLGRRLCDLLPDQLCCAEVDGVLQFTARSVGGEQLSAALAALSDAAARGGEAEADADAEDDSDDELVPPAPPIVISEADFREKVREKRVGILKPQGSLERAREERAMANTQDDPDTDGGEDSSKSEDKKETRKPRVNIAMAAIMRKQEETNKQVKFVTPPPTPESAADTTEAKDQEKPKVIQPKAIKGLASLPLGRKTGGILSLKDKSAGYPHLVNTDPEPKKTEKEEKKEPKPQGSSQNSQSYQPKRQEVPSSPKWGPNLPANYNEAPRMGFQKNYGIQNAGIAYNPNYPSPPLSGQGIRLPVVNPKEIDVRTAALQKQNSRQELFQDGHKFGNYNYQMSCDKKNFLNDLPPRFANQYRYWQAAQESQLGDNKFRDEPKPPFAPWPPADGFAPPQPWQQWKPDNPPGYGYSQPLNQPGFYSPQYRPFGQPAQAKPDALGSPGYLQAGGQPQLQSLQSVVGSANFTSSLGGFGSFAPPVGYDAAMYPQFGKPGYPPQKPPGYPPAGSDLLEAAALGYGAPDAQRALHASFNDPLTNDNGAMNNLDQSGGGPGAGGAAGGSTYSLFSGAPDSAWGAAHHQPHQSLWSGPGPSPLERLLEQQKQMKPQ